MDTGTLAARIETNLGYQIGRSFVMAAFGLAAGDRVIGTRVPDDAFCTERIKTVMRCSGTDRSRK